MQIKLLRGVENLEIDIKNFNTSKIIYHVKNVPIHTYDQHARARVGVKFYDYKVSEDATYSLYTEIYDKLYLENKVEHLIEVLYKLEEQRNKSDFKDDYNLMSRNCEYMVEQEISSLRGQMSRRLKFCEEEQIVGLHFLLREKLINKGGEISKIAETFLPGCDLTGECDYIAISDHLSNAFGCLFDACGRHPYDKTVYRSFNKSCTTPQLLKNQLGFDIIKSKYEIENNLR